MRFQNWTHFHSNCSPNKPLYFSECHTLWPCNINQVHKNHPRLLLFPLPSILTTNKSFEFLPQAITFFLLGWLHWLPICALFITGSPTPIKLLPKRSFYPTESHTCFKHVNASFKIKLNFTSRFTVHSDGSPDLLPSHIASHSFLCTVHSHNVLAIPRPMMVCPTYWPRRMFSLLRIPSSPPHPRHRKRCNLAIITVWILVNVHIKFLY